LKGEKWDFSLAKRIKLLYASGRLILIGRTKDENQKRCNFAGSKKENILTER